MESSIHAATKIMCLDDYRKALKHKQFRIHLQQFSYHRTIFTLYVTHATDNIK